MSRAPSCERVYFTLDLTAILCYLFMRLRDGKAKVLTLSYDGNNVYDEKLIEILDKHGIV